MTEKEFIKVLVQVNKSLSELLLAAQINMIDIKDEELSMEWLERWKQLADPIDALHVLLSKVKEGNKNED